MKWLLSPTNQTRSYLDNSLFPSTPASYSDVRLYKANAFFGGQRTAEVFCQAAEQIKSTYLGPESAVVGNVFHFQLSLIEAQNKNPESAWNDAQQEIQRQLSH
jgi:cellobiose transport system substrate-binding protein